ncbi:hypothetical protein Sjap_012983 [Stephania japonica]|uniref:AAA+ ATPase domain-containing protein n=1 Tax=Stephania japonica TaxID=461633 RepID=A0AAP0IX43_9MAGN
MRIQCNGEGLVALICRVNHFFRSKSHFPPLQYLVHPQLPRLTECSDEMVEESAGPDRIPSVINHWTCSPLAELGHEEKDWLLKLSERLKRRVVGQDVAVDAVGDAILRSRAGLGRPQHMIGSFLFVGLAGVGKTQLARALAEQLFGNENLLTRIDMSDYTELESVSRLIGTTPRWVSLRIQSTQQFFRVVWFLEDDSFGSARYAGHRQEGHLTEAVRMMPHGVILFDKVDKAHAAVLQILLRLLDGDQLTDFQGRIIGFTNIIIIMTSNVGAMHILGPLTFETNTQKARERVTEEIRRRFRSELLDRLDDVIIFNFLSPKRLRKVARLQLRDVASRLAERGVALAISEDALDLITMTAYHPEFGGKPIKAWLEKNVVTQLSKMMIKDEIEEYSTVYIDAQLEDVRWDQSNQMGEGLRKKEQGDLARGMANIPASSKWWMIHRRLGLGKPTRKTKKMHLINGKTVTVDALSTGEEELSYRIEKNGGLRNVDIQREMDIIPFQGMDVNLPKPVLAASLS